MNREGSQKKFEILDNYLLRALDIEDHMSFAVYGVYLIRSMWPKNLSNEPFQEILKLLRILIDDTERHKKIIKGLIKRLHEKPGP
ncbi:hypothetical protein C4546_02465 [Candidatus Parcubacteria bacterium]|jgi:hypothetical protein|nr:MAG: hypothetical protein C4546_02465 [Candidatus Parcubacteria bacterium]